MIYIQHIISWTLILFAYFWISNCGILPSYLCGCETISFIIAFVLISLSDSTEYTNTKKTTNRQAHVVLDVLGTHMCTMFVCQRDLENPQYHRSRSQMNWDWETTLRTVASGDRWKHCSSANTSMPSALVVYLYTIMHYINRHFTYLLTYRDCYLSNLAFVTYVYMSVVLQKRCQIAHPWPPFSSSAFRSLIRIVPETERKWNWTDATMLNINGKEYFHVNR